jgi:hypothetical protein
MPKRNIEPKVHQAQIAQGRRAEDRATSVLRMAALQSSGVTQLCRITNVSSQGIQARVFVPIDAGNHVCIRVPDECISDGKVVWTDGNLIGVHLTNPLPASALLRFGGAEPGRRRLPRVQSQCDVRLRCDSRLYRCALVNISPAGAMIVPRTDVPPSGPVEIMIPDLPKISGQVRWVDGDRVGILFNDLLQLGQLTSWLKRWGVTEGAAVSRFE